MILNTTPVVAITADQARELLAQRKRDKQEHLLEYIAQHPSPAFDHIHHGLHTEGRCIVDIRLLEQLFGDEHDMVMLYQLKTKQLVDMYRELGYHCTTMAGPALSTRLFIGLAEVYNG